MEMKKFDTIVATMLSMLCIFMIITQIWNPDYIGALFTGYIIGYTLLFWLSSKLIHSYRSLVISGNKLVDILIKENAMLTTRIHFMNIPVKKDTNIIEKEVKKKNE